MANAPEPGQPAPDFTLPGIEAGVRRDFTLAAERGRPVVLAFYPGDETMVCTAQLCSYQSDIEVFRTLDSVVWGISTQDVDSHEKFATKRGLTFPLLADVDHAVHKLYGSDGALMTKRAVYVVDAEGVVRWRHVSKLGITYQHTDKIAEVLRGLAATPA